MLRNRIFISVVSVLAGLVIIAGGIAKIVTINKMQRELSSQTDGVIVSCVEEYGYDDDGNRQKHLYPVFTYTVDGQKYERKSDTSFSSVEVGKSVVVFYDPDDPGRCYLSGENKTFMLYPIIGMGGIFVIISIRGFWRKETPNTTARRID